MELLPECLYILPNHHPHDELVSISGPGPVGVRMDSYPIATIKIKIDAVAKEVRRFYKAEKDVVLPIAQVRERIRLVVHKYGVSVLENNGEALKMTNRPEYDVLREMLVGAERRKSVKTPEKPSQQELFIENMTEYNGYVNFCRETLEAMVVYLAYRSKKVVPTRLNKLLFYADFSYYTLRGRGMSGAEYTKLTHGPIFSGYKELIGRLQTKRKIRTKDFDGKRPGKSLRPSKIYSPSQSILGKDKLRMLDWVIETYDHLTTKELIDISHRETGYWDTHWKQPIDYRSAEYLEIKPPKDLLNNLE